MISFRHPLAALLSSLAISVAHALEPSGSGQFVKLVPGAQKAVPAAHATLSDKVTYSFVLSAPSGDHALLVIIYDGNGREAFRAQSTLAISNMVGGRAISYGFDKARDAPGTWWYMVRLDDRIVLSNSLEVGQ